MDPLLTTISCQSQPQPLSVAGPREPTPVHFYRSQRSCDQGYGFTRVCDSVHGGRGAIPACIAGGIPACLAAGLWVGGVLSSIPCSRSPGGQVPGLGGGGAGSGGFLLQGGGLLVWPSGLVAF